MFRPCGLRFTIARIAASIMINTPSSLYDLQISHRVIVDVANFHIQQLISAMYTAAASQQLSPRVDICCCRAGQVAI